MSGRRARSPDSILEEQGRDMDNLGDSNSDPDERPYSPTPPPARQTSIRLSRRSDGGGQVRVSANRQVTRAESSGRRQAAAASNSGRRRRAPTPIVRRTTRATLNTNRRPSVSSDDYQDRDQDQRQRGQLVVETRRDRSRNGAQMPADGLTWYERLMPDFVLNMTAPITGYESRLDSDVEDDEYEILERQRLKRNRRVRRRLLGLILVGAAVGAFMYSRGKMCQKMGVKAAISQVKHRMEDGLAKSIQDTMGK